MTPTAAQPLELVWLSEHGRDIPHVVTERSDVTLGIVRETAKGLRYEQTGYVAAHVRPATPEELRAWQFALINSSPTSEGVGR